MRRPLKFAMPGLVPGIHIFLTLLQQDVDGRVKPAMTKKVSQICANCM
jgi:hypothetical protein